MQVMTTGYGVQQTAILFKTIFHWQISDFLVSNMCRAVERIGLGRLVLNNKDFPGLPLITTTNQPV